MGNQDLQKITRAYMNLELISFKHKLQLKYTYLQ